MSMMHLLAMLQMVQVTSEVDKNISTITLNMRTRITMITTRTTKAMRLSRVQRFLKAPSVSPAVRFMRVNGETSCVKVTVVKSGLTARDTRATGLMTRQMGLESCSTQTVTSTKESGKMTRLMERAPTLMLMGRDIRATGETISSMGSVLRRGLTVPFTRDSTARARKTGRESSHSLMDLFITETLR